MKKKTAISLILLMFIFVVSGCKTPGPTQGSKTRQQPSPGLEPRPNQEEGGQDISPTTTTTTTTTLGDTTYYYRIQKGDTLAKIAKKVYGDSNKWRRIKYANPNINLKNLKPGQKIKIPQGNIVVKPPPLPPPKPDDPCKKYGCIVHTITEGETLQSVSLHYYDTNHKWPIIAKANGGIKTKDLKLGQKIKVPKKGIIKKTAPKKKPKITEEPINAESHIKKGNELFSQKKYLEAKKEYEQALDYNPQCSECKPKIKKCVEQYCAEHYKKGKAYIKTKQPGKAYDEFNLVVDTNPDYEDVKKLIKLVERFK